MARKRVKTSKRWVEVGPIAPWMQLYAQWLAGEPGAELSGTRGEYRSRYPTAPVRGAKASFYAKRVVQVELVRVLEKRADFREYFDRLRADTSFQAKELAKDQIGRNFELRAQGLEMAAEAKDHKAIEHYTRPFLDHAFPKKEDKGPAVQRVTINLIGASPEQKKLLLSAFVEEEPDEISYEIIPNEKLIGDGDDD